MSEAIRRVRPTPIDTHLGNPHKGCCTFQHFNGDEFFPGTSWSEEGPLVFPEQKYKPYTPGYLPSKVAYCRWFWRMMEPEQGKYDFSMIEKSLEICKQRGQTLAVRLMSFGWITQPQVPDWYASKYPMKKKKIKSADHLVPDHNAPEYLEHWGGLVREFARRYDIHPQIETIDVTYIGPWGEGGGECSNEQCVRFAQLWQDVFIKTPRLCMVTGEQMRASIQRGAGWRCDCFGDVYGFGTPDLRSDLCWNHHYECYPREVVLCGATEAWKTGPVHFESCWVPMHWYQLDYDLDFILQQGLKFHGTYFMPKYTKLPEEWLPKLAAFCRKLGYRYIFRNLIVDSPIKPGGTFRMQAWIENVGVAPIYRPYTFALRFQQGDREEIIPLRDVDIRTWLPGDMWLDKQVKLPDGFRPGWVNLSAGLVDPVTNEVKVRFAVKEQSMNGWLDLNGFEIVG